MMKRSLTDAAQQLICNQVIGSNPIAGLSSTRAGSRAIRDPKNTIKNLDGRTKVALKIEPLRPQNQRLSFW
jgi:hypothetical protein